MGRVAGGSGGGREKYYRMWEKAEKDTGECEEKQDESGLQTQGERGAKPRKAETGGGRKRKY